MSTANLSAFSGIAGLDVIDTQDADQKDRGKWLLHGEPGGGKTTAASTIARVGPTALIDLPGEKGTQSFAGADYEKNITIFRPDSLKALDSLYYALAGGGHGFQAVILDSLTALQHMSMDRVLEREGTAIQALEAGAQGATQQSWGKTLDVMTDVAEKFYALSASNSAAPMHVVMIAQTKLIVNELTGEELRMPDVQRGAMNTIVGNADYVTYCEAEPDYDADPDDDTADPVRYVMRFGAHPGYRTKARVRPEVRKKIPSVIGRGKSSPDLYTLSRVLGLGGVPAVKKTAAKNTNTNEEN